MVKKFIILLVTVQLLAVSYKSAFAGSDAGTAQEKLLTTLKEEQWIKKHHGVIFYQDFPSDRYDFSRLISLAKELGTDLVKTWLKANSPGEILKKAQSRTYTNLFDSFSTICLNVCPEYIVTRWDSQKKYSSQTREDVQSDFFQLTKFFIDNYDGKGKTFIVNYFFEINVYMGTEPSGRPGFPVLEFISDAQRGVKNAIAQSKIKDIQIFDSIEANCDHDTFHFVKNIFPKVQVDLYSLSFYGTGSVRDHLGYWSKYALHNGLLRGKNVMVGEYGIKMEDSRVHGDEELQRQYLKSIRDQVRELDSPYIFLFWLTDQESKVKSEGRFGLIDLNGYKRKAWEDLYSLYRK